MNLCRNCQRVSASRRRGLCWSCYHAPGVREKFPSTSKMGRRGVGYRGNILPEPTDAPPGTEAKVRVLEERARLGQALWHPLDSREESPTELFARLAVMWNVGRRDVRRARVLKGGAA